MLSLLQFLQTVIKIKKKEKLQALHKKFTSFKKLFIFQFYKLQLSTNHEVTIVIRKHITIVTL